MTTIIEPNPAISALWHMIGQTLENQSKVRKEGLHLNFPADQWAMDYCTVRFKMGRGLGHTTAGLYLAKKLFSKSLFLVSEYRQIEQLHKTALAMGGGEIVITTPEDTDTISRHKKAKAVFLDQASHLSEEIISDIYYLLSEKAHKEDFCFVFLA